VRELCGSFGDAVAGPVELDSPSTGQLPRPRHPSGPDGTSAEQAHRGTFSRLVATAAPVNPGILATFASLTTSAQTKARSAAERRETAECERGDLNPTSGRENPAFSRIASVKDRHRPSRIVPDRHNLAGADERSPRQEDLPHSGQRFRLPVRRRPKPDDEVLGVRGRGLEPDGGTRRT
jgi:hypothetical protein